MSCATCTHFARPGKSDGYCAGREDFVPAYGANHPLRQIPARVRSGEEACTTYEEKT